MEEYDIYSKPVVPNPNLEVAGQAHSSGKSKFMTYYFSSNFIEANRDDINAILHSVDEKILVAFERWEPKNVFGSEIIITFVNGERVARAASSGRIISGDCLLICFLMNDDSERSFATECLQRAASLLRLFFGQNYALDLLGVYEFDLVAGTTSHMSGEKIVSYHGNRPHDEYKSFISGKNVELNAKDRTLDLLYQVAISDSPTIKFIMYWLAVEVQIGNGERRRNFCLKTLKSQTINNELERLRVIRNECLKDGAKIKFSMFDEYSISSVIRLACIANDEVRCKLKDEYLNVIENPSILR